METTFGERLRRARTMRGYSLRGLADALERQPVSHSALQKYEKDQARPDSRVLLALSSALNLRPDYFFEPCPVALEKVEFRKRTKLGIKKRKQIEEEARAFFERYAEIERILDIETPPLPRYELVECKPESLGDAVEDVALKMRGQWKLGLHPVANVAEMLEENGVKLKEIEAPDSFDGFAGWADGSPVIVLAQWLDQDLPRKRMTALHELGHLVLGLPGNLGPKKLEGLSYRFAGAMLLPAEAFRDEMGGGRPRKRFSLRELTALKEQWGISIKAILKRAETLGLLTRDNYVAAMKWYNAQNMGQGERGCWAGSERSTRFEQLVHRAAAMEVITRSKAAGLLEVTLREFDAQFGKTG